MSDTESKITVTTDHKWKQFRYRYEVPSTILHGQFEYLDADDNTDGFFEYRGHWYHTSDFTHCDERNPLRKLGWHGYHNDSFYSGVVIKVHKDGSEYQVGTYMS